MFPPQGLKLLRIKTFTVYTMQMSIDKLFDLRDVSAVANKNIAKHGKPFSLGSEIILSAILYPTKVMSIKRFVCFAVSEMTGEDSET